MLGIGKWQIMGGYLYDISITLSNPRSNCSNSGFCHKLYRHFSFRVDLLFGRCQISFLSVSGTYILLKEIQEATDDYLMEIKDQLSKILNRINVVMRRWRYKWNTRFRISQPCYVGTNFFPRQLTTFAGLCTLSNFYFQLISIGQECWSYSKPTWSNLNKMQWVSQLKRILSAEARNYSSINPSLPKENCKLLPHKLSLLAMHFQQILRILCIL